jgi:hypothetical protein
MLWRLGLTLGGVVISVVSWRWFLPVNAATIQSFTGKGIGPVRRAGLQFGRWFGVAFGILLVATGLFGRVS